VISDHHSIIDPLLYHTLVHPRQTHTTHRQMSSHNRLAIYGHRGWASSIIVQALMSSGAPVKVLYRAGSDLSNLHGSSAVERVEVDTDDLDGPARSLETLNA